MATAAAAVVAKARRDVISHFMSRDAVSADKAVPYQPDRRIRRKMFERFQDAGVLKPGTQGRLLSRCPGVGRLFAQAPPPRGRADRGIGRARRRRSWRCSRERTCRLGDRRRRAAADARRPGHRRRARRPTRCSTRSSTRPRRCAARRSALVTVLGAGTSVVQGARRHRVHRHAGRHRDLRAHAGARRHAGDPRSGRGLRAPPTIRW